MLQHDGDLTQVHDEGSALPLLLSPFDIAKCLNREQFRIACTGFSNNLST